jgi:large subunit ribosomal protein L4
MKTATANIYDMEGAVVREVSLDPYVFAAPINRAVLHQVVTVQLLNRRQGNASTKTRGEVSGGNRKPYRQKGTGRARQGSTRAPHFRGGGTVFGPRPHLYHAKVNKKMRRLAIRSALSDKARTGHLLLVEGLAFEEPSTKAMKAFVERLPIEKNVLALLPERDENVILSAHNLHVIKTGHVASINVVEILKYEYLLLPLATVDRIVEMFGRDADDAIDAKRHPALLARRIADRARSRAAAAAGPAGGARPKGAATPGAAAPAEGRAAPRRGRARDEEE